MAILHILFRGIPFLVLVLASTIVGMPFVLFIPLIAFLLLPVPLYGMFRSFCDQISGLWLQIPPAFLELCGVKPVFAGDAPPPPAELGEPAVIFLNHRCRTDWCFLWSWIRHYASFCVEKVLLKAELRHLHGPGWGMQQFGFIFLVRNWDVDKKNMTDAFESSRLTNFRNQYVILPEGTDLTAHTKAKSDQFAHANNLPEYKYVLHPRTTGFCHTVNSVRDWTPTVYDVTVAYPDGVFPAEKDIFTGRLPSSVHFHTKRYNMRDLPVDEEELANWCKQRFAEKEARLAKFYQTGRFEGAALNLPSSYVRWVAILLGWSLFTLALMYLIRCSYLALLLFLVAAASYTYITRQTGGLDQLIIRRVLSAFSGDKIIEKEEQQQQQQQRQGAAAAAPVVSVKKTS